MRRGETHFTGGCDPEVGTSGTKGCCLLCGGEWYEENCCGSAPCPCHAQAEEWRHISYKNIIMYVAYLLSQPYVYFYTRWYS